MNSQHRLRQFIEEEADTLISTLRFYVSRAGLAPSLRAAGIVADEVLNETVAEALEHAERFRSDGQPRAWMLGIAANLIKRRQSNLAKRNRREPLARDLVSRSQDALSEDDLFDRLAALGTENPADQIEHEQEVMRLLAPLSKADQEVVRLAVLHELDGRMLAQALGIKPGAARVRLHRALARLRKAWGDDEAEVRDGE